MENSRCWASADARLQRNDRTRIAAAMRFSPHHFLTFLAFAGPVLAIDEHLACEHGKQGLFPAPASDKPGRKFARDRLVDIAHLALDVTPDFAARTVRGSSTLTFSPIALPLPILELDAIGLRIDSVECTTPLREWTVGEEKITLAFQQAIPAGTAVTVIIQYQAQPERGLYFRTPEMGYPAGDTQVWSQGEAELHRFWFPCYDYPNERFTSEVRCHVPEGMTVISNGVLTNREKDAAGLTLWHWKQDKPHVNYLVALAAGYFHEIKDSLGALPLSLLVPPSEKNQAAAAFADTRQILEYFQEETGVPFPWDKYAQVYAHDFVAGGMENTSCSFMAARLLFHESSGELRSVQGLNAHEAAHQWFGDLITCRDWSHLWLNEGFASYYTDLYEERKNGQDGMKVNLWKEAQRVISSGDTRPIVWKDYRDPMEQFDSRAYPKGAWVLHMLRSQLGVPLYRTCVRKYLDRHRNGIATSDDLQEIFEEMTGRSFDQFFDQWIHHGGVPELEVNYGWDAENKQAKLSIRQTQKVDANVPLFRLPIPVEFTLPNEKTAWRFQIIVSRDQEDFHFSLPAAPDLVRLDPDYTVLAKWNFKPPGEMLGRQLKSDLTGRLLAIAAYADRKDEDAVNRLQETLKNDSNYLVRGESAGALTKIGTRSAIKALAASLDQADARPRLEVVQALAGSTRPEAREALDRHAATEKNPEIVAAIIESWSTRPGEPDLATRLRSYLRTPSYNQVLAVAAMRTLRAHDDSSAVPEIIASLQAAPTTFDTGDYAAGLDIVAFLSRNDANRDPARQFLVQHLTHPKEALRTAAARALGTLNDPKALAFLQPLTSVRKPFRDPVRDAAEKAISALSANQSGPPELQRLWTELQAIQKKNQDLEAEIEKLKKQKSPATK